MSQKEAQSEPTEDVLRRIEASVSEMGKQIKGIKGQQGLMRARLGMERPGTPKSEPEPSPIQASAPQSKPDEAQNSHGTFQWMKDCPNCGGKNPDYKAPTVACADCGVPLSSSEDIKKELLETKKSDKIKPCWNCESAKVKIVG